MIDGKGDGVGGVVKVGRCIVILQGVVHDNRSTRQGEPSAAIIFQVQGSVSGFPDGAAMCGFSHSLRSIIGTGGTVHHIRHRVGSGITDVQSGLVVEYVFFLAHREIAGIADIGVLDHHALVLPIIDVAFDRVNQHVGIVGIGPQHTHINIVVIPVVPGKGVHEFSAAAVLGDEDLVVKLLLEGFDTMLVILLPQPGKHQLQVGFAFLAVLPGLGIHIGGISIVIATGTGIEDLLIHRVRLRPRIQILEEQQRIALIRQHFAFGSGLAGFTAQGNRLHGILNVDFHLLHGRSPVLIDVVPRFVLASGLDGNAFVGFHGNGELAGITKQRDCKRFCHFLLVAPVRLELDVSLAAHHKGLLPMVFRPRDSFKVSSDQQLFQGRQGSVVLVVQKGCGNIHQSKDNSLLRTGIHRENLMVHLVVGEFQTESRTAAREPVQRLADMVRGLFSGFSQRIEIEIHPLDIVLVKDVVAGLLIGFIGLGLEVIFQIQVDLHHRTIPFLRNIPFPAAGQQDEEHHQAI